MKKQPFPALLVLMLLPAAASAAPDEFIAFPGVTRTQTSVEDSETTYSPFVDLFYSADFGGERRFKVLAEVILTDHAHEMQRLQLGWQLDDAHTLWAGRYHTPVGYWNTAYHHGQYLQTAVSRPALVNFEHASGVLPTHFTGLQLEGAHVFRNGGGLDYILAAGETATFEGRFHPVDVLAPDETDSELGTVLRVGYRPDALADNQFGLLFARSDFAALNSGSVDEIRQTVAGAYVNWEWRRFRTIAELMRIKDALHGPAGSVEDAFTSLYVQGEQKLGERFTAFGRVEKTWSGRDDAFLQLLPRFALERQALGVRFDFKQWQALTLEIAHREERATSYDELLVQWSAVLP